MPPSRFNNLEPENLEPDKFTKYADKLKRFDHIEIAGATLTPMGAPSKKLIACPHCGQENEKERPHCWACFKSLRGRPDNNRQEVITVLLNGVTYRSDQPQLPARVELLMNRIRREGYSPKLAAQWAAEEGHEIKRASGVEARPAANSNAIIVRVDDRVYRSDDPDLPPEIRPLLDHLRTQPLTPELMDRLRQAGANVKYRPASTLSPSDGDQAFWSSVPHPL